MNQEVNQMSNYIGEGSSYDADMDLIESFVYHKKNPRDLLANSSLFNYYISRVQAYWIITKNFINKMYNLLIEKCPIDDFTSCYSRLSHTFMNENFPDHKGNFPQNIDLGLIKKIKENLEVYENKFLNLIRLKIEKFQGNGYFETDDIIAIFDPIGVLMCFQIPNFSEESRLSNKISRGIIYPYPNNTGLFGFNTYLYALFNDVVLVGVPSHYSQYDGIPGCPSKFMLHDYSHNQTMEYGGIFQNIHKLKNIYHKILSGNLTKFMKELLVFVMWIEIHEIGKYLYYPDTDLNEYIRMIGRLDIDIAKASLDFNNELLLSLPEDVYRRYASKTTTIKEQYITEYTSLTVCMIYGHRYILSDILKVI